MAKNPFDDENGTFYALINHEEQYSLWPTFKPVPGGWTIVYGAPDGAPRQEVLDWIEQTWTDLRPKSLRDFIAEHERKQAAGELEQPAGSERSESEPEGAVSAAVSS